MVLALQVLAATSDTSRLLVGVEEPGYPTIFDTYERLGCGLLGIEVDEVGATPQSLDAALSAGAQVVLLTPRAHNPTGASWTVRRLGELADVLADHAGVLAIEDDQFAGIAVARPGSLLNDRRIADRVVYVRSFSKSIAPDLRIAVAVAGPFLRRQLAEAKSLADGSSSGWRNGLWQSRSGMRRWPRPAAQAKSTRRDARPRRTRSTRGSPDWPAARWREMMA